MAASRGGVGRWARRLIAITFVLALGSFGPLSLRAGASADCRYVLGFQSLARQLPPVVGQCLDNEQHNPANGDAVQRTTHGLLVWRKSDNDTAFTDGYRTWVNGPTGIAERLNNQRFAWENNPAGLPLVPGSTALVGRCRSANLAVSQRSGDVAVGNVAVSFSLRSIAPAPCSLYGFPGVQLLDAAMQPLPTFTRWSAHGYLIGVVQAQTLIVPPGGTVYAVLEYTDVPNSGESCPAAAALRLTPPNAYASVVVPLRGVSPCGGVLTAAPLLAADPFTTNGASSSAAPV